MNRLRLLGLLLFLFSCDDGDLQIETINFDDGEAMFCGTVTTNTTLLFKINGLEGLILEIPSGTLANEIGENSLSVSSGGETRVNFRIFSDNVTSSYFCDEVPPSTPTVVQEIIAEDGDVLITTTSSDDITFSHNIQLSGISLVTENNERITDLRINDFGTVTTSVN